MADETVEEYIRRKLSKKLNEELWRSQEALNGTDASPTRGDRET